MPTTADRAMMRIGCFFRKASMLMTMNIAALIMTVYALCYRIEARQAQRVQSGACSIAQGENINELLMGYTHITTHCSKIALSMLDLRDTGLQMGRVDHNIDLRNTKTAAALAAYRKKYSIDDGQDELSKLIPQA